MKYALIIVGVLFLIFPSSGQDKFKTSLSLGLGQFKQTDLKEIQRSVESRWANIGLKKINNFPIYFYYGGEFSYRIKQKLSFGLTYRFESTGYKSSYADYSGSIEFNQILKVHQGGILISYPIWKSNLFAVSTKFRVYRSWSTIKLGSELKIQNEFDAFESKFVSKSIIMIPGCDFSYFMAKNIEIGAEIGYAVDFKGNLKFRADKNLHLKINNQTAETSWSGLRVGLSLSFLF